MNGYGNIATGLTAYASGTWTDNDYSGGGGSGTGIQKVGFQNVQISTEQAGGSPAAMWANYMTEINAGHLVEVSFSKWVDTNASSGTDTTSIPEYTLEQYAWLGAGDPHSVVGMGYIDPTPSVMNDDEYFVAQDGWQTTGQYVKVPVDTTWLQNDYVQNIPEPATLGLIAVWGVAMLIRRKRLR